MGIGKTAAQVAHASLAAIIEDEVHEIENFFGRMLIKNKQIIRSPAMDAWINGRFTKLVVYVKSKEKLLNLADKLDKDGIRAKLIYDACFTVLEPEEANGTTLTCMGVIPLGRDGVPRYLKKLQLLD